VRDCFCFCCVWFFANCFWDCCFLIMIKKNMNLKIDYDDSIDALLMNFLLFYIQI
jgi:hypothetical protein